MTRTHNALAAIIDRAPVSVSTNLESERTAVLAREEEARATGDNCLAQELAWERAIIDLNAPPEEHYSLFRGSEFEPYADFYGLTDETLEYARDRARETSNLLLRVHHLEYALARGPNTGEEWFTTRRQLVESYRELIDFTVPQITGEAGDVDAVYVSRWIGATRIAAIRTGRSTRR